MTYIRVKIVLSHAAAHTYKSAKLPCTYKLVLLERVNEHLTRFLVAKELVDLVEDQCAHQRKESHRDEGANAGRLGQASRQVLIEID